MRPILTCLVVFAAASGLSFAAQANVILTLGNNPQPDEENVLFDLGLNGPATTVFGTTSQTSFRTFFTSTEPLVAPSNGQARVEAVDGAFRSIDIGLTGGGLFSDLILNLNTINGTPGTATISGVDNLGNPFSFTNLAVGNGANFFTLVGTSGELLTTVHVTSTVDINDLRQPRISGASAGDVFVPVPEPTPLSLIGVALLALGAGASRQSAARRRG